ncbi:hypothetical protein [Halobellus sp. EA9]|uniref:hypothetical protein n=1 Tax=Halobellus sp. EA9 TaxID=3421647 RepID=UPI003EBA9465
MKRTTILAAALAVLVAATGAAVAAPGSTAQSDVGSADAAGDAPAQAQSGAEGAGDAGPPDELPGPVPDFVSEIHGLIQQFIDGTLDSLGPSVSEAAGNGDGSSTDGSDADTATTGP